MSKKLPGSERYKKGDAVSIRINRDGATDGVVVSIRDDGRLVVETAEGKRHVRAPLLVEKAT